MSDKKTAEIGDWVWYHPTASEKFRFGDPGDQPLGGHVAHVNKDGTINVCVIDMHGQTFGAEKASLIEKGAERPADGYCEWPVAGETADSRAAAQAKLLDAQKKAQADAAAYDAAHTNSAPTPVTPQVPSAFIPPTHEPAAASIVP